MQRLVPFDSLVPRARCAHGFLLDSSAHRPARSQCRQRVARTTVHCATVGAGVQRGAPAHTADETLCMRLDPTCTRGSCAFVRSLAAAPSQRSRPPLPDTRQPTARRVHTVRRGPALSCTSAHSAASSEPPRCRARSLKVSILETITSKTHFNQRCAVRETRRPQHAHDRSLLLLCSALLLLIAQSSSFRLSGAARWSSLSVQSSPSCGQ